MGSVNFTAALLGIAIVLVMLNFVVLWTLFARSRRRGWQLRKKNLSLAAGAMAVLAFLVTIVGVSLIKQRNNYFALAMSDIP